MKIIIPFICVISLTSCENKNDFSLANTQKDYWQVYTIKNCGSDYSNNPKSSFSNQRWSFSGDKYFKYTTDRKGFYRFVSPVGRDFVIDNSWHIKNDSLYLDGGNLRMHINILDKDSLMLSGISNCMQFPPSGMVTKKVLFIYALSKKSK